MAQAYGWLPPGLSCLSSDYCSGAHQIMNRLRKTPEGAREATTGAEAHIDSYALCGPFDFAQGRPLKRRSSTILPAFPSFPQRPKADADTNRRASLDWTAEGGCISQGDSTPKVVVQFGPNGGVLTGDPSSRW